MITINHPIQLEDNHLIPNILFNLNLLTNVNCESYAHNSENSSHVIKIQINGKYTYQNILTIGIIIGEITK